MRAVSLIVLLAGCGPNLPASYPGPPDVQLGTGYQQFVAISDGDAVPIIMGLQGGFHVWGSVRARWLDPFQLHLHFTITLDGQSATQAVRDDNIDLAGTDDGTTYGEHLGSAVIFNDVAMVRGQPCDFTLEVTDQFNRTATVEKRIVPM